MSPERMEQLTPPELRNVSPARRFAAGLTFALAFICAVVMLVTAGSGCGAGAKGCAVVDATKAVVDHAAEACIVLRYLDEGGQVREEHVTTSDLRDLGTRAAARRLSASAPIPAQR